MCLILSYLQSKRFFEHAVEEARATARNVLSRAIGLALVHRLAAALACSGGRLREIPWVGGFEVFRFEKAAFLEVARRREGSAVRFRVGLGLSTCLGRAVWKY
jgi:hypothetical protein